MKEGMSEPTATKAFHSLAEAWKEYYKKKNKKIPTQHNPEPPIEIYKVIACHIIANAINREDLEEFKKYAFQRAYGVPNKTEYDLTVSDLTKFGITKGVAQKALNALEKLCDKYNSNKACGVKDEDNPKPPIMVYKVKPSTGMPGIAIPADQDSIEKIKNFIAEKKHILKDEHKKLSSTSPRPKP